MPTPPPLELPEEESVSEASETELTLSPAEEARAEQIVADVMADLQAEAPPSSDESDPSATFSSDIKL